MKKCKNYPNISYTGKEKHQKVKDIVLKEKR